MFVAIICSILLFSCNNQIKHKESTEISNPLIDSFKDSSPADSLYLSNFYKEYNRYQSSNFDDSTCKLLIAYGVALYTNSLKSDVFKTYSLEYFERQKPDKNNIIYFQLANMIACNYTAENRTDSAKHWFRKGMNSIPGKDFQKANGFACSELGKSYLTLSNFDSAEQYYLKAIQSFEQIKDTSNLTTNYLAISSIFQNLHQWNSADQYLDLAYKLQENSNDTSMMLGCLNMKASVKNEGLTDTIDFIKLIDSSNHLFYKYTNPSLYEIFVQHLMQFEQSIYKHELKEAFTHLNTCDSTNKIMMNDGIQMQIDYMNCIYTDESNQSLSNSDKAESLAKNFNRIQQYIYEARVYKALMKTALLKSDYKSAYTYKVAFQRSNDSILEQNNRGQILELERKYQTQKKENQLQIQAEKLTKNKFQITALLLTLSTFVLIVILFSFYRKRKNAQQEIIRQQQFTDALIQNTEDERKRIASDLHDGVNHELLTLKNKITAGNEIKSNEIDEVIQEVRQVSRDLYPAMFDNIGLKASIEMLCERLTEAGLFTTCEINYQPTISKRNELQLYRIIQEALNNTLKHAKANAAKVTIETKDNELLVEIKDNGIGFDANQKMNDNGSFGLQSFHQRTRSIGGKSKIDSNANGTTLILTAPLN